MNWNLERQRPFGTRADLRHPKVAECPQSHRVRRCDHRCLYRTLSGPSEPRMKYQNRGIDAIADGMNARIDGIDAIADGMNARIDGIDAIADGMNARIDGIEAIADGMNARIDGMDAIVDGIIAVRYATLTRSGR